MKVYHTAENLVEYSEHMRVYGVLCISFMVSGAAKLIRSCGIEGYKNTRKGTNIAAQATAISFTTVSTIFLVKYLY